jgi:hypothetical protein
LDNPGRNKSKRYLRCGDQPAGASSKPPKEKLGATVQPTSVPFAEGLRCLPGTRGDSDLRHFTCADVAAQTKNLFLGAVD